MTDFRDRPLRLWRVAALAALVLAYVAPVHAGDARQIAAAMCAACHGVDGNSADPAFPKLAGQTAAYLGKQLRDFASGKRRSEVMAPMVAALEESDMTALAEHFSKQVPAPGAVQKQALLALGKQVYEDGNTDSGVPACAGCHKSDGAGYARFPRLAGQHQAYLLKELGEFKSGHRANDRLMVSVGQRLTAEEIEALAEYAAGL